MLNPFELQCPAQLLKSNMTPHTVIHGPRRKKTEDDQKSSVRPDQEVCRSTFSHMNQLSVRKVQIYGEFTGVRPS